ncbi:SDR family oxidoreductase [Siculibacillus lacustris]|uniref:SDR family oxidoreductase n=1 Tax=Siculibacillus lacustris TaxID=1549641 RepID=A0A4Q9VJI4_9HYPH|nr:SDR family oxidoreductase [Siculibacillus lacustris]TBW35497.1 SDR family oxidoreductase [Siculibacillus lacustris]
MFDLKDRRILVVGGSSGIGLGVAHAARALGAAVTIASRDEEKIAAAVAAIGGGARGFALDTRDEAAVAERLAAETWDDVVVSAAATRAAAVRELPLADAYASMNSKFWGAYRIARAARIRDGGSLTFVTGYLAVRPKKGAAIQGAINAALEALARGLALEFAPVRVNAVSPGFVDTPLWGAKSPAEHAALVERIAAGLPAGIAGRPEHVALQIVAGIANPYLTGSVTYVDGGGTIA